MRSLSSSKQHKPSNPHFERDAKSSFSAQGIMSLLGASMRSIAPGYCIIDLPFNVQLTQQDGFFHAGATCAIADSAGGYAAYSLMPPNSRVLTVEFKTNLISPAKGDYLIAEARVIKSGKTLTVSTVDVYCQQHSERNLCAIMQQTTICIDSANH